MPHIMVDMKQEAIRLRVEERLAFGELLKMTGASRSSLSTWLKPYPLTEEELRTRRKTAGRYAAPKKERGEVSKFFQATEGRLFSRSEKGKIAEAAIAFRLAIHGFAIYGSMYDGDKADWIVRVPETAKLHTIQVRWARAGLHGLPYIGLVCSTGHNTQERYAEGAFDFIVGYDFYTDTAFVYSAAEVAPLKTAVSMNWDHAEQWDKLRL